jgi:hypothetical protein
MGWKERIPEQEGMAVDEEYVEDELLEVGGASRGTRVPSASSRGNYLVGILESQ